MSKLHNMRVIEIPKFRAVSSGVKYMSEMEAFDSWVNRHQHLLQKHVFEPLDFLWHEDDKSVWIYAINDDVTEAETDPYEIIEFPGGIFLVATGDERDIDDLNETVGCMYTWINNSDVFEYGDFPKSGMCNMPNPSGTIVKALNIAQQQVFLPLKFRAKE